MSSATEAASWSSATTTTAVTLPASPALDATAMSPANCFAVSAIAGHDSGRIIDITGHVLGYQYEECTLSTSVFSSPTTPVLPTNLPTVHNAPFLAKPQLANKIIVGVTGERATRAWRGHYHDGLPSAISGAATELTVTQQTSAMPSGVSVSVVIQDSSSIPVTAEYAARITLTNIACAQHPLATVAGTSATATAVAGATTFHIDSPPTRDPLKVNETLGPALC